MLGLTVCLTFFSYLIKLVQGKRIFRAGLLDITVILFGIVLLFGGIVSAGGCLPPALRRYRPMKTRSPFVRPLARTRPSCRTVQLVRPISMS